MIVKAYHPGDEEVWDNFVGNVAAGTLFHTRKFLSYHGDRFADRSLLLWDESNSLRAVFPAAVAPEDVSTAISHPGATYGGLIFHPKCDAIEIHGAVKAICAEFQLRNLALLQWKTVPGHLASPASAAEHWALWQAGFKTASCELWNVVDLRRIRRISKRRRKLLRELRARGVDVEIGSKDDIPEFYQMLTRNLRERYNKAPVHTENDLQHLLDVFPEKIRLLKVIGTDGVMLGGAVLMQVTGNCTHTQYIAVSDQGRMVSALKLLLETAIEESTSNGDEWFSFGASTETGGMQLNPGLYKFKAGFGHSLVTRLSYSKGLKP